MQNGTRTLPRVTTVLEPNSFKMAARKWVGHFGHRAVKTQQTSERLLATISAGVRVRKREGTKQKRKGNSGRAAAASGEFSYRDCSIFSSVG